MNRRTLLTSAVAVLAGQRLPFPDWINRAEAQGTGPTWRHGLAKFGELKYPTGFKQFELRQCERTEGRRGVADRTRYV